VLFRGYVPTKDKECTEKFKNRTDLKTYDQVKHLPEFAGILSEDTVLIDIDDFEQSEILFKIVQDRELKCKVYKTSRGKHFYFKNDGLKTCKTHTKLAICITADIKLGCRNSYAILKFNNVEREVIYDTPEDEIQTIPKWLFPIRTSQEFMDMEAGDGRNQALFNYILTLQSEDFTIEEARETIRIINNYVMKDPLSGRELETIIRDEAFKKPIFLKGNTFLFDKFAVYLKNNDHVIKLNGQLHIYDNGIYTKDQDKIEAAMIRHISGLSKTRRKEVLSYLSLIVPQYKHQSNTNLIAFNNGLYDFVNDTLMPFSPDIILTNKIPWNYNPAAAGTEGAKLVDETLDKISCHDPEIRALLEECVGYCFFRKNELGKAFILTGDGANGKSTFIDMIKTMLGEENVTSLDLKELGDRFKTAELAGKLANLGDDIGEEFIANPSVFKKLVTGEAVNAERKGLDPFEFCNYSKMLFSANAIPRIKDKSGGLRRRLVIIPFEARFTPDDPGYRPFIKYDLQEPDAVEYLILLGIRGLKRVLANRKFTTPAKVDQALVEYEKENNSIVSFIEDYGIENVELQPTNKVYQDYCEFCQLGGLKEVYSHISFTLQMKKRYGLEVEDKKIKGVKYRIFVKRKG